MPFTKGHGGLLSLLLKDEDRVTPLTSRQFFTGLHRHKNIYGQFRVCNSLRLHAFGLQEEAGEPGENQERPINPNFHWSDPPLT